MTGMEPHRPPAPSDDRRPHQMVPDAPTTARGEILVEGSTVIVTFHLPEFALSDLDYRVGTRTVSVWSRRSDAAFRSIVVLPLWVNPSHFLVSHKNGVFEFLLASPADGIEMPPETFTPPSPGL